MTRTAELRTNFTAGELSKLVNTRSEYERFYNGSEVVENWAIFTQGALFRRKGLRYLAETKYSDKKSALIDFQYSSLQTYAIEIGHNYMRFFANQGVVLDGSSNILEIATPYTEADIFNTNGEFNLKFVQDSDVMYIAHPSYPVQKLIRTSATSFSLSAVEFLKGSYMDNNVVSTDLVKLTGSTWTEGATLTLTASGGHTPFTANHVGGLWKMTEGTDIAHVKITGYTSSTVVTVQAKADIPSALRNVTKFKWAEGEFSNARSYPSTIVFHEQRMILAGSIKAPQRIWFSKSGDYEYFEEGTNDDDSFKVVVASQRGDPIRWLFSDKVLFAGGSGGVFRITSSSSSGLTPTNIDIKKHISYGCSYVQPELVGQSPIYMQKGNRTARAINYNLDVDKYVATDITADADHITESSIVSFAYQQTPLSSLWCVKKDGQIAKLTFEADQKVQAWSRYLTKGSFESVAVINDAEDNDEIYTITKRTINGNEKRFIEVHEPNYLVDNSNRFYVDCGLSYNGIRTATLTIGTTTILSNTAIFSVADVGKELHETSTGNGKATITGFTDNKNVLVTIIQPFSSTSITSWGVAIKIVTGLNHLIGEKVVVSSDGATETIKLTDGTYSEKEGVVNNSGQIELKNFGLIIHVGLAYSSKQKNMPLEAVSLSNAIGTSQHKKQTVSQIVVTFQDTSGGMILNNNNETIPILTRSTINNQNETTPLFAGDQEITVGNNWDNKGQVTIFQEAPQPMTIKSITYKVNITQ